MEAQKSLSEDWLLWGLLGLALFLAGGYYALGFLGEGEAGPRWVFQGVDPSTVTALRSYRGDRPQVTLRRTSGGTWSVAGPRSVRLDQSAVRRWVRRLLDVKPRERFPASAEGRYGFDTEARRVEIDQDKRTHRLYLGGSPPVGTGFYVRYGEAGQGPIFLLPDSAEDQVYRTLDDVRRRELFAHGAESVSSLTLEARGEEVTYERGGRTGWAAGTAGGTQPLDDTGVDALEEGLSSLLYLRAETFYDTEPPPTLHPRRGSITLGFQDTAARLVLGGQQEGKRVVKVDDRSPVTVDQDPVRSLGDLPFQPAGWPDPLEQARPGPLGRRGEGASARGLPGASE